MSFAQLVEEVSLVCEDELGDTAVVTDGITTLTDVPGFFRRTFEEVLSETYGLTQETNTFECRVDSLAGLDLSRIGRGLAVTFDARNYAVLDLRYDTHVNVLLVLSR